MLVKIIDKTIRELYRLVHPQLWGKNIQINGVPRIYDINKLKLGNNISINTRCVLQSYGGIKIGNNVTISDGAKILTRSLKVNNYIDNAKKTERDHVDAPVEIGAGTWIATNAIVLPGVKIPRNCIIAAGAVVTKSLVGESSIYAGVPARFIKHLE